MDRIAHEVPGVAQAATGDERCGVTAAHWAGEAVPVEVARLRAAVAAFANHFGAPKPLVDDVRLAVSEALTNAVMHAYPDARGRVDAHARGDPATGLLTIRVRDYGIGCRPRIDSPGLGMGLALMAVLTRTMDVASPADGGTEVRLTFAVAATVSAAVA
jgi:serine/threonine-protein kinase RsbW/stage II sporulation protein AB (anti-sigma F factor)